VGIRPEIRLLLGREGSTRGGAQQARARGLAREELSRHSQVQHEAAAEIRGRDQVLAAAIQRFQGAAAQPVAQPGRGSQEEVAVGGSVERLDAPPDQEGLDATTGDLDLGKLGHGGQRF